MRVPRFRLIVLLALSSVSLLAQGQTDLPQFRAGVELVQLDVAVLDDKRQPVRGLTAADFTVLDNGVATPIRAFTPVELAPRTRSTEAVWANEVAARRRHQSSRSAGRAPGHHPDGSLDPASSSRPSSRGRLPPPRSRRSGLTTLRP